MFNRQSRDALSFGNSPLVLACFQKGIVLHIHLLFLPSTQRGDGGETVDLPRVLT